MNSKKHALKEKPVFRLTLKKSIAIMYTFLKYIIFI